MQARNQDVRGRESKSEEGNQENYKLETFNCNLKTPSRLQGVLGIQNRTEEPQGKSQETPKSTLEASKGATRSKLIATNNQ